MVFRINRISRINRINRINRIRQGSLLIGVIGCLAWAACSDDDRCGEGFVLEDGVCLPVSADSGTDAAAQKDSSMITDGPAADTTASDGPAADTTASDGPASDDGGATDATLPTGMGDSCSGPGDCAGKEADYCALQPGKPSGYCTLQGCSITTDDCPEGYGCCDMPAAMPVPNFCATDADKQAMDALNMCSG